MTRRFDLREVIGLSPGPTAAALDGGFYPVPQSLRAAAPGIDWVAVAMFEVSDPMTEEERSEFLDVCRDEMYPAFTADDSTIYNPEGN